jgi:hypothetical protein
MVTLSSLHHEIVTSSGYCYWLMPRDDILTALGVLPGNLQLPVRSASAAAKVRSWTN